MGWVLVVVVHCETLKNVAKSISFLKFHNAQPNKIFVVECKHLFLVKFPPQYSSDSRQALIFFQALLKQIFV